MSQNTLPLLTRARRNSLTYDREKLKKIHMKREHDWEKLETKVKGRYKSVKMNEDSSFIKDMLAFQEYGKELAKSIQDTTGFKLRRKHTITKILLERYEAKFNSPYSLTTPKQHLKLSSIS